MEAAVFFKVGILLRMVQVKKPSADYLVRGLKIEATDR